MQFSQNVHVEFSLSKVSRNYHVCLSVCMCTCVCWCLPLLLSASKIKAGSLTELEHWISADCLGNKPLNQPPAPALGLQMHTAMPSFSCGCVGFEIRTSCSPCSSEPTAQDLVLTCSSGPRAHLCSLYPLDHLFSYFPAFLNTCVNYFNGE